MKIALGGGSLPVFDVNVWAGVDARRYMSAAGVTNECPAKNGMGWLRTAEGGCPHEGQKRRARVPAPHEHYSASTIAAQEGIMSSPTPTPPLDPETSSIESQQTEPQQQTQKQPEPQPSPPDEQSKFDIGEEYGTARKNLPPAGILAICIAVVLVIVAVYSLTHRAHALSTGSIDDVTAVDVPGQNMVMVAINVTVQNNADKPSWIHTIGATLDTGKGKFDDDASPAVDAQRYFQAFPALKQHAVAFLMPEARLDPKNKTSGMIVVSFPVTQDVFNARKSLTVTVTPYDEMPVVMKK
jgi:hypothetical protein